MAVRKDDAAKLQRLAAAVRRLDYSTREVFLLHRLDDQDYTAIAARLGISVAEVEARMADALRALRRAMDP